MSKSVKIERYKIIITLTNDMQANYDENKNQNVNKAMEAALIAKTVLI